MAVRSASMYAVSCLVCLSAYYGVQVPEQAFPNTIARVDRRGHEFVRMSNVTEILTACSIVGQGSDKLLHRDGPIEATSECLARAA